MKAKQFIIPVALVVIAMVFQACPSPGNMHGVEFAPTRGEAAILTLEDTVQVRYREDPSHAFRTVELYPSPYVQMVYWIEADTGEELTDEQRQERKLRVKKLTNHNTSYAIYGGGCMVNDAPVDYYQSYRDPSDTIKSNYQFGQLVEQIIPLHPKPCELDVIIDALIEQYPDRITVLDDTEVHYIGSIDDAGENATRLTINL